MTDMMNSMMGGAGLVWILVVVVLVLAVAALVKYLKKQLAAFTVATATMNDTEDGFILPGAAATLGRG